jgi:hypothetical protein
MRDGPLYAENQNYRQVANWLTRERIPAQRNGRWTGQSVKNLVKRYERLAGSAGVEGLRRGGEPDGAPTQFRKPAEP